MWSALRCLNKIQIPSLMKASIRHYMKTSDKMELLLKQSDHVPFNYELIYRNKNVKLSGFMYQTVNFVTCVTVTTAAYHIYYNGFSNRNDVPNIVRMFETPIQTAVILITTAAMLVLASVFRHRYALRVYYNNKNKMYKAIFTGKLPFSVEHYDFPAACMTYVKRDSILPWKNALFNVNGRKIIFFEPFFRTYSDFHNMLDPGELENSTL